LRIRSAADGGDLIGDAPGPDDAAARAAEISDLTVGLVVFYAGLNERRHDLPDRLRKAQLQQRSLATRRAEMIGASNGSFEFACISQGFVYPRRAPWAV
jgi:hypothetical protein